MHRVSTNRTVYRYLIQRKQNGNDGNTFTYEAGANAVDELENKGGIDAYIEQVGAVVKQALGLHLCEVTFYPDKSLALQLFTDTVIPAALEQTQDMEVE